MTEESKEKTPASLSDSEKQSEAGFAAWRKKTIDELNRLIGPNGLQGQIVATTARAQLVWNTVNVVVRVLYKKGILNDAAMIDAARELMAEAKANAEAMKVQNETGVIQPRVLSPLDIAPSLIYPKQVSENKKKEG